ncbi:MAG: hypothetical protein ACLSGB_10225 [Dorea sp.]
MEKSTDTVAKSVKVNGFIRCMNVSPSLNRAKKWRLNTCKNGKKKRLNDKEAYAEGERAERHELTNRSIYLIEQGRNEDLAKAATNSSIRRSF